MIRTPRTDAELSRARSNTGLVELARQLERELSVCRDNFGCMAAAVMYEVRRVDQLERELAEAEAECARLRELLEEVRADWVKVGYGASHEDVAACRDVFRRITEVLVATHPRR